MYTEKDEVMEQLTLFPPGTLDHANLLVKPGTEKAKKMTVTSGRRYADLLKPSDPVGLLVKMLLGMSHWASTKCFLTWETSGTPSNRLLYRLVPSTPHIDEIEFSLWPTPIASSGGGGSNPDNPRGIHQGNPLATAVKMWPTPRANDAEKRGNFDVTNPRNGLPAAAKLYNTPTAQDAKNSTLPPSQIARHSIPGDLLRDGTSGQLNPMWVEWLMGFPIGHTDLKHSEMQSYPNKSIPS